MLLLSLPWRRAHPRRRPHPPLQPQQARAALLLLLLVWSGRLRPLPRLPLLL
jgi:hypothetical protein